MFSIYYFSFMIVMKLYEQKNMSMHQTLCSRTLDLINENDFLQCWAFQSLYFDQDKKQTFSSVQKQI